MYPNQRCMNPSTVNELKGLAIRRPIKKVQDIFVHFCDLELFHRALNTQAQQLPAQKTSAIFWCRVDYILYSSLPKQR